MIFNSNFGFGFGFTKMHLRCRKSLNIDFFFFQHQMGSPNTYEMKFSYDHICHACKCQSISDVSTIFYKLKYFFLYKKIEL
jgi:hypothetical protein